MAGFLRRQSPPVRAALFAGVAIVVLVGLAVALLMVQAGAAVARIEQAIAPWATVTHDSVSITPGGDLSLKNVRITSVANPRASLVARSARLRIPGPVWLLRAAFGQGDSLPPIDAMGVRFSELTFDGSGALHPALAYVGWTSGAPFEAAGCGGISQLTRSDLLNMTLRVQPATLDLDYETTAATAATLRVALEVPGSSAFRHVRWLELADARRPLVDAATARLKGAEWDVVDDGFVTARNRWCAQRQRTTRNLIVVANVSAISDLLAAHDVMAEPGVLETYRRYAQRGGQLGVSFTPAAPIAFSTLSALDWVDGAKRLGAKVNASGRQVPLALQPLQASDFVGPPELPKPQGGVAVATTAAAGTTATLAATAPATGASTPPPGAAVAAKPEPSSTPASASNTPPANATAVTPLPPDAVPSSPTRTVASIEPAAPPRSTPAPPEAPKKTLPKLKLGEVKYAELAGAIDRRVTVETVFKSRRYGVLRDYNGEAITLEIEERGGAMLVTLPKATVVRAEVTSAQLIPKPKRSKPDAEAN